MSFRKTYEIYFTAGVVNVSLVATSGVTSSVLMLSVTVTVLSETVCSICSSGAASELFLQFEKNTAETRATKITAFFKNKKFS
jgi:hypothetical protein